MRSQHTPFVCNQPWICGLPIPYYSVPSYWAVQDYNRPNISPFFSTQASMPSTIETLSCVSQRVESLSSLKFFNKGETNASIKSLTGQNNYDDTDKFQDSQNQRPEKPKHIKHQAKSKNKNQHQSHKKEEEELKQNEQSLQSQAKNFSYQLRQKFGRNIRSNIFHLMLNKILKQDYFDSKIQSIIQKFNLNFCPRQFKFALNKKVKKLTSYISVKKMLQFNRSFNSMNTENGNNFALTFKILCRLYLSNEHIIHIYNSRKIQESSKKIHIRETRSLLNEIL